MVKMASRIGLFPFKVEWGKGYKSWLMNMKEWEKTKYYFTTLTTDRYCDGGSSVQMKNEPFEVFLNYTKLAK